ncbi:MAG: hypothetical protein AAFZ58_00115 [Pseudomonadota bacterium]
MKNKDVLEIIECLPNERTLFYYFKDRYALEMLRLAINESATVGALRRSPIAALLDKPIVKATVRGDGLVIAEALRHVYRQEHEIYRLTLDAWGSGSCIGDQTSRPGRNLVLQLNFSNKHDTAYKELITCEGISPFMSYAHPVALDGLNTLAWSRLDIDLATGEALIEEIQSDWLRFAAHAFQCSRNWRRAFRYGGVGLSVRNLQTYVRDVLAPHQSIWDEAMLMATIWFLRYELGVRTIYFHTHASGAALKRIEGRLPPRSIYEALPKRFCFQKSDAKPSFLHVKSRRSARRKLLDQARFRVLAL